MTVTEHSLGGQKLTYRVTITLSQGSLVLSNGVALTGDSVYRAEMLVDVSPIAYDHEGVTTASITLEQKGPYVVVGPGGQHYRHATLNDLLKVNPPMNAVIVITSRVDTGEDVNSDTLFTGRIVRPVDITPSTITFECEQREQIQQRRVPINTIEATIFSTDALKKSIPQDSTGEVIPVSFGRFLTYVPPVFSLVRNTYKIQQELNICGYHPVVAPTTKASNRSSNGASSDRGTFAYAETVDGTGHLFIDVNQTTPSLDGYFWVSQLGTWGRITNLSLEDGFSVYGSRWPTSGPVSYAVDVGNQPYFRVGVLCKKFIQAESTGTITNAAHAIDRKMENYAEIPASAIALYEVGTAEGVGRISANYNEGGSANARDQEGVGYPTGIRAYTLFCFPSGTTLPSSGFVRMAVTFPGDPETYLFSTTKNFTFDVINAESGGIGGAAMLVFEQKTCDLAGGIGGVDDGWIGTKWARGDFSAGGSIDAGDDIPISHPTSNDSRPVRVLVDNSTNATMYLSAVGFQVAFKADPNSLSTKNQWNKAAQQAAVDLFLYG